MTISGGGLVACDQSMDNGSQSLTVEQFKTVGGGMDVWIGVYNLGQCTMHNVPANARSYCPPFGSFSWNDGMVHGGTYRIANYVVVDGNGGTFYSNVVNP